jgi:hypothetical protein
MLSFNDGSDEKHYVIQKKQEGILAIGDGKDEIHQGT